MTVANNDDFEPLRTDAPGAWPESAVELLEALRNSPPEHIKLFCHRCTPADAAAVLNAADPLQAARGLMTKELNEMDHKIGTVERT